MHLDPVDDSLKVAHPSVVWMLAAVLLGSALALEFRSREPLDDSNPAYQRPGLLLPPRAAPSAPVNELGVPRPHRRAVVFFVRAEGHPKLRSAVDEWAWPPDVDVAIIGDDAALAATYGLRRPRDGGTPVGYAVVDQRGRVRYATLDPHVTRHLREVETVLQAL